MTAPRLCWWLGIALLGLPALALPPVDLRAPDAHWAAWALALCLNPDAGLAQPPWAFWTTAWLHGSAPHLWRNLGALLLIGMLGHRWPPTPRQTLVATLLLWPGIHVGLLAQASLHHYVGLSGVLHGLLAMLLVLRLRAPERHEPRWALALALLGLIAKVLMENPWQMTLVADPRSAINVAPWAHLCGVLVGLTVGAWPRGKAEHPAKTPSAC